MKKTYQYQTWAPLLRLFKIILICPKILGIGKKIITLTIMWVIPKNTHQNFKLIRFVNGQ